MSDAAMDPAALLGEARVLRLRSRSLAHGGAWFPALVLAGLPVLSGVLYRAPLANQVSLRVQIPYQAGLPAAQRSTIASYVFWLLAGPLALVMVALWYRRRSLSTGVRLSAWVPVAAGGLGLALVLAVFLVPARTVLPASAHPAPLQGLLSPLLAVGLAAVALGYVERSPSIAAAGGWLFWWAWQDCTLARVGGLFGWQSGLLGGGPHLGGRLTLLGADLPLPALLLMSVPLAAVGAQRALRVSRAPRPHR